MIFRTPSNPSPVIPSDPGSRIKEKFKRQVDDHGNYYLVKVGQEDLYEYTQSFAKETDINYIMKRYAMGDTDILQRAQGVYMDAAGFPQDLMGSLTAIRKAQDIYANMPGDMRSAVGSFEDLLAGFADKAAFEALNARMLDAIKPKKAEAAKTKEVVTDAN